MKRTDRLADIRSANSREARNCSAGGTRLKSKGRCLCGFMKTQSDNSTIFCRFRFSGRPITSGLE